MNHTRIAVALFLLFSPALLQPAAADASGEQVYLQHCAHCHDSGSGRTPSRAALGAMSPADVMRALESGSMRLTGNMLLSRDERIQVAEYLTGAAYRPDAVAVSMPVCTEQPAPLAENWSATAWNGWGNGLQNLRYQGSTGAGLEPDRLRHLRLQWAFGFPGQSLVNAQPTVAGGRVFVGSHDGTVYSLRADSGCVLWKFDAGISVRTAVLLAPGGGRVLAYFGNGRGHAWALDAETGALVWDRQVDTHPSARLTGGFQYFQGRLFVPVSSVEEGLAAEPNYHCCTFRGSLVALDAATGTEIWRRYTIPESATRADEPGEATTGPSGAGIWSAPAISVTHQLVYVSTGNNYSGPPTPTSDAVLALHLDTGEIAWTYQGTAGDAWNTSCLMPGATRCPQQPGGDLDMGAAPILVAGPGGERIVAAQKSGVIHVLDAATGRLIWNQRFGTGGISGGFQWGPAVSGSMLYAALSDVNFKPGVGVELNVELDPGRGGGLHALDIESGTQQWMAAPVSCAGRALCSPAQSAAVTAIPGAVFSGSMSGVLRAHDMRNGKVLWEFDTARTYDTVNGVPGQGGGLDGPGVVVADGRVFVTSGYGLFGATPGNVLLVFGPD